MTTLSNNDMHENKTRETVSHGCDDNKLELSRALKACIEILSRTELPEVLEAADKSLLPAKERCVSADRKTSKDGYPRKPKVGILANQILEGMDILQEREFRTLGLTPDEKLIARRVLDGEPGEQIARELDIPLSTMKYRLKHIYEKAGVCMKSEFFAKVRQDIEDSEFLWKCYLD